MSSLDFAPVSNVRATGVLADAGRAVADEALDRLTRLAARLLGAPAAVVSLVGDSLVGDSLVGDSLVGDGRQIVARAAGSAEPAAWEGWGTPLGHAFGRHVVDSAAPLVIEDARAHPLGRGALPAQADAGADAGAAYAGVPLTTARGQVLGSLGVLDTAPRRWSAADLETLADVARAVTALLECRAAGHSAAETSAQRALRESEARFRGVFEGLRAAALQLDAAGRVTFANDALLALTGRTREETLGADWFAQAMSHPTASRARYTQALARGEIAPRMEREIRTRDGGRRVVAWDNVLLRDLDGRVTGVASVGQDVTERRALEARLAALAEHDELTGLLNRRGFWRLAEHALKATARGRRHDAVLYVDLERFGAINDAHGHAAGDEALRAVARVIRATIRDADLGARFGGDDFAVYALGLNAGDGAVLAARLHAKLEAHNDAASAAGRPFRLTLGIGVAELEPGDDLDALLARADAALCALKLARRA